ncbi:MAG: NADH-quinone oxidoreductase subunit A [Cyclobacteriaceae bacterium]|nr:NADH-quinone oxidoreductase subunit A [Cyclobacteriaceae bacterium]MCH8515057.1 NADH-quinone oxidoreductase subunit A [Cyclobacteriaceae bacterium]
MIEPNLGDFAPIALFIGGAFFFLLAGLFTAKLIRPSRPNEQKLSTYECGEESVGMAWGQFNVRFYIVALIFLLFDVEILFLFPWATVFADEGLMAATNGLWAWFSFGEIAIFVFLLALGLAFVWRYKYLDWLRPTPKITDIQTPVPDYLYRNINANIKNA